MIRAYLTIYEARMGDRLTYDIDLPSHLDQIPFPPMLIQPLVENAIKHGLDPQIEGGKIFIRAGENDGILRLEVVDTGPGFFEVRDPGIGLSNIRERLESIYGDRGRLILEENFPKGLKAAIEVPCGQHNRHHRRR
jgi:sensor histidine kinase YesM